MIAMMEELLTIEEVAQRLRVSTYTVKRYIKQGELEVVRVGGRKRVTQSGLARYISKRTTTENK